MRLLVKIFLLTIIISCGWSEAEKDKFTKECRETSFTENYIYFEGFNFNYLDSIKVVESMQGELLNTIYIIPEKKRNKLEYSTNTPIIFNIKSTYTFYIDNDDPYVLKNMKMIVNPNFTMTQENYECILGEYEIDGNTIRNLNITFTKRK